MTAKISEDGHIHRSSADYATCLTAQVAEIRIGSQDIGIDFQKR